MNNTPNNSDRVEVAFSFFSGSAGLSRPREGNTGLLAIRCDPVRGAFAPTGLIDGKQVDVLSVSKSPVDGYVRVAVRFQQEAE